VKVTKTFETQRNGGSGGKVVGVSAKAPIKPVGQKTVKPASKKAVAKKAPSQKTQRAQR
jgi:hypothetical protein